MENKVYCTTYCNRGHRVKDGVPVGHECYVLPAEAVRREMEDDFRGPSPPSRRPGR
jgi:hypothetical protein